MCYTFYCYTKVFCLKKFVCFYKLSHKGIVGDHFQLFDEFLCSLPFCFTSDLDYMGNFCFCFCSSEHIWVGRFWVCFEGTFTIRR